MNQEIPPYRKKRPRPSHNKRVIGIITLFFLLLASVLYIQSPLGRIQSIEVTGNHLLSQEEVVQVSGMRPALSILQYRPRSMKEQLLHLPEAKDAAVQFHLPNYVTIDVQEWQQVARLQQVDSAPAILLENGEVLYDRDSKEVNAELPVVLDGTNRNELLIVLASELVQLPHSLFQSIQEIRLRFNKEWKEGEVLLSMEEGYQVETTLYGMAEKIRDYPDIAAYLKTDGRPSGVLHMLESPWYEPVEKDEGQAVELLAEEEKTGD